MNVVIHQAGVTDIPVIEAILKDVVCWMDDSGMHQWKHEDVKWNDLSKYFAASDFYIAYVDHTPAACMALVDYDPQYWPDIPLGESLFLHKVAVMRDFSGKGISKALIDFAKQKAKDLGMQAIRLDCNQSRHKVRAVYEKQGFVCVEEKTLFGYYHAALYACNVSSILDSV